jgi:hypothetical protein
MKLADASTILVWISNNGFFQVPLAEEHKERTAFQTGFHDLWSFVRAPMGLTGSPYTFMKIMQESKRARRENPPGKSPRKIPPKKRKIPPGKSPRNSINDLF